MTQYILIILSFFALGVYWLGRPGMTRSGPYLPDFVMFGLVSYVIGSATLFFSSAHPAADEVLKIAAAALFSVSVGFTLTSALNKRRYPVNYAGQILTQFEMARGEQALIYIGLLVCAAVCALFSITVLGNARIAALLPSFLDPSGGSQGDLLAARKAITNSTEGYLAPGFVKQFRDILPPILFASIAVISVRHRLSHAKKIVSFGTLLLVIFAMLLTGVRSNLFLLFITLFLAYWFVQRPLNLTSQKKRNPKKRSGRVKAAILIGLGFSAYAMLTILLGRIDGTTSTFSVATNAAYNLFDRVFLTVPRENIFSHDLWSSLQSTSGEFWMADLGGVLPGSQGATLTNLLHAHNGGSLQGNSILGLGVDTWVNWGFFGLVFFPFLYAILIGWFDLALTRMKSPVAFGIKVTLAVALIKIYSPFGFLLYGGAASLIAFLGVKHLHTYYRPKRKRVTKREYRLSVQSQPAA